ncbi:unnamed protein product [Amoebophrya sp. A25]|nr:unnamed protein product [Amoebophrya sp. A25]|eukprot:GSA25T00011141001.1
MNAFDKSEETSWIDIRDKSPDGSRMMSASKYPLWVGVDFGNAPTMSVNCIRIWQHPQHFARDMRLEYWDGVQWGQVDYGIDQKWNLEGFSGGSWQRWPAGFQTVYRIQNAVLVPESWEVDEFGFYDTVGCLGTPLSGDIIVSGFRNPYVGTRAVDGIVRSDMREPEGGGVVRYPDSFWRAGCSPCDPGTAYIGMDFGFERRQVKCMRIWQAPAIERQSPVIDLMYWNGRDKFVRDDDKRFFSIGGGSWNRRPAMSNSMFRLRWVETRPPGKRCDKGRQRSNQRSWGVAEVEFFSDDDCNSKIPLENNGREPQWPTSSGEVNTVIGNRARNMRATVVTGGYRQIEAQASVNYDYYALNAADGKLDTIWGADCRTAMNGEIDDAAMCSERDWVGFDFGAPKTVKCIKILQARSDLNQCCDPAARMAMDRWNGTDWVMTEWRHEPQDDGTRDAVRVRADFTNMGQCTPDNIERRGRRETESCMIPLSSITRTLGHPLCIKHEWCTEIGFRGDCCPTGGDHMSRCCCTYLKEMKIFVDEIDLEDRGDAYDKMDLEMVTIQWTKVLPFWFMILAIIWFVLVNLEEPDRESKYHIYWERHCLPLRLWFNTEGYAQRFLRKFTFEKSDKPQIKAAKFLSVMLAFFVLGGALIWIILAYVAASFVLYCYFMAVLVVKWCKSVYFPGHDHDEWRRHAITQVAINPDQSDVKYPTSLGLVKVFGSTLAFTFFFFFRWIFDLLLFQSIMFMLGFGDTNISAYMIVLQVPRISIPAFDDFIDTGTDLMNSILGVAPASYVEILFFLFNGIPRCKGPAVLFGSMNIMAICLVLIKILNYDFFGLFAAGRYAISTTKPSCQQALCLGWNMLMEAFIFVTAQCFLVAVQMFKDLAMPGSQNWMCPWDDGIVVFIALMLLYGLIISFLIIVILCANGHFYGQDYILGPLGRQLGMNFDRLDPDGTGPDGGMINLEVLFAVIPTTFGVWLDDWNVPAYLMVERAHVYAEELWTPHKCDCCGEIHVPYEDIIRAQSRNVSLCYQALPAGLLFGKLCEYMNFPPIYYEGKRMRCLLKVKHSRRLEYEFYGKLMNTWFPRISSLFSFGLYIQLIATILAMTEENYQTVAKNSFYAAFALCFVKSSFHIFARRFVLFLEGRSMEVFLKKNPRAKPPPSDEELKRKDKEKILGIQRHELPNLRILLGHLAHGIVIGSVYGGLAVSGQLISETAGLWVGMSIGLAGGWLPIYMYYLMENPDVPIFLVGSFKIGFAMVIALGAFFLADEAGYSFRFAQIMASTCFTLQALPAVVCFKKRTYDERGILSPSLLQPVLFTYRGIPNYLAIITAMFMTCIPAKMLVPKPLDGSEKERVIDGITTQGNYRDLAAEKDMLGYVLFALIIASYLTGIVAAFLVAEQLHKRPVVLAIASAYMMILALQPFMFILFALFIGVIFGLAVGGHIESREVQRIKGISLHDKIQVYGDLSHADSKAARVEIQKEQKRQAYAIQNAIDEQRPICLPGEMVTIDEFGDPTDPDYVAPLELPAIPSIAELVQQKLDGEEDIVKDLKMSQSRAAIQFAAGLKDLQSEEKPGDKVESMSSIGQVGSANPNRSLVAQKMNLEKIKSGEATGRVASPQLALTGGPGALPLEDGSPSGGGRKPDHALEVLLALEGRPGARLLNVPQLALPTIDQEGDIVAEEEEEEENTVDADDMKLEVTKSPDNQIVAAGGQDPADMEHGHDMVLRDNEPAQYTFDETVHQWYDPYTGYYYDDARQEWYLPQSSGGTGPSGSAGPPKATRASSLRSQAEHIQRMHDRKKGVRKPGGR